ncbi:TetR/AcrR family transcriptional regulator [Allorhizobium terrae]|uniref:TetR/AcrR family transcriptional regulator n=1 Tax=Allorhizobium terrae TaxID=1848972 RepID=A0A4S3ZQC5_9HYPH|nr:TetR/AcrR family transcriptional regulator [Allorhizobium terrae]THF47742.1 TetR/AcrR family transcriptional regulator [Allorhizobium terrae]TWD46078.1 TetR family transcriptional regulator [Agrobacterium vitis]
MGDTQSLKPKSDDRKTKKCQLVLDTAGRIFMEQGYDRASMDLIAAEAGVSKATIYAYFENKEAILSALIIQGCEDAGIHTLWDTSLPINDIEMALRHIARNFTKLFLSEQSLGIYKLIISNASNFPEIAEVFMNAGPRKHYRDLDAFFRQAIAEGHLKIDNIDMAAKQFLNLVQGDLHINWALSMKRPKQSEYDALIEGGVRVFLAAYGTQRPQLA